MSVRSCPDCGLAESHRTNARTGRLETNLDPISGRCVGCLGREAVKKHTFHSRREDRGGEAIDTKQLQAGKDAD